MCARARACVRGCGCVRVQIWLISWVIFKFYVFKSELSRISCIKFIHFFCMGSLWDGEFVVVATFVDFCLGPVTGCCMFAVHNDKDWT